MCPGGHPYLGFWVSRQEQVHEAMLCSSGLRLCVLGLSGFRALGSMVSGQQTSIPDPRCRHVFANLC